MCSSLVACLASSLASPVHLNVIVSSSRSSDAWGWVGLRGLPRRRRLLMARRLSFNRRERIRLTEGAAETGRAGLQTVPGG